MLRSLSIALSVISGLLLMCILPAWAQEEKPAPPLSLQDCLALAAKNQTDILLGQNSLDSAKQQEIQSKSGYYPQVSLDNTFLTAATGTGRGLAASQPHTSLTISETFYDGGLRDTRILGAVANTKQSRYGLQRTQQSVKFDVTSNYFNVLRAKKLAGVQESQVKYLDGQLALIQARVEAGDAAQSDALPIQAQLASARVGQLSANNSIRTASIQLQSSMSLSPTLNFDIQDVAEPTVQDLQPIEHYLQIAQQSRPDLFQSEAAVQGAKTSVKAAKIVLYPVPTLIGQMDQPFKKGFSNSMTLAAGFTFDIFDGGNNRAAYKIANDNLANTRLRAQQTGKDIATQVEEAYINLTTTRERLAAADLSVAAAQKNFDAQDARYREGIAIPLDLLNAQVQLVSAQSDAVQARYDYYTFLAQLEFALGIQGGLNGN